MGITNFPNGVESGFVPRGAVEKTANYTVVVNTDAGKTFYATGSTAVTFTLPSIATAGAGEVYTFINMCEDGTAMNISPNALDHIIFGGNTTDDKDMINTAATAKKGDYITVVDITGTTGWDVVACCGVWAKEA